MSITFRERFIGLPNPHTKGLYAPLTLGCSKFTSPVDYKVFKKDLGEKIRTAETKAEHKRSLVKFYGKGKIGKRLNISSS